MDEVFEELEYNAKIDSKPFRVSKNTLAMMDETVKNMKNLLGVFSCPETAVILLVGITATMLTKCLRELEQDKFITRKQYSTIPPTVEYSLAARGKTLIPALESVYQWADEQMQNEEKL